MHTLRPGAPRVDILIIDDDELFGAATLDRLKAQPWRVAFHQGPFGTVNAIRAAQPRLLILDLNMPGLEGTRIHEMVKKRGEMSEMKVLLLSSTEPAELAQIAKDNGFDGALHKSVTRAELVSAIANLLGKPLASEPRLSGSPDRTSSTTEGRISGTEPRRRSGGVPAPGSLRPPPSPASPPAGRSNRPPQAEPTPQLSSARKEPSGSS